LNIERDKAQEARERRRFEVGAFCTHCGTKKGIDALYCTSCGARLPQPEDFAARFDSKIQIEVSCPGCEGGLRLTLPLADRQFRCPKCARWFRAFISTELVSDETALLPYHEVLGTDPSSTNEQVRRAYRERIAEYHPDKVASLGVELRTLAEGKSKEINEAYQRIMKARGVVGKS
jgi:hypothetical protein